MKNPHGLVSDGWELMDANLPVQAWTDDDGRTHLVSYMPRKEACWTDDDPDTHEANAPRCRDAAKLLRNLADLMEAFADGKIDHVYYPDKVVSEAIEECARERAEKAKVSP